MAPYAHKPRPVDFEKSRLWALASLNSVGVGPLGEALYDLVNRHTHRAHRMAVSSLGPSKSLFPVTGSFYSFGDTSYTNFTTAEPVSFADFNHTIMEVREISIGLYSWDRITILGASFKISGGGISVPNAGDSGGRTEILYGDGNAVGSPDLEVPLPNIPDTIESPQRTVGYEDGTVFKMPVDVLFAFGKYRLKPGPRTQDWLGLIAGRLENFRGLRSESGDEFRFLIVGHTDNIGTADYNRRLSKRRAQTVKQWLVQEHNYLPPNHVKSIGRGFTEPVASNATPNGREKNRRVEAVALPQRLWDSWSETERPIGPKPR